MTMSQQGARAAALQWVTRLYPSAYRELHGAEVATTLADIADGGSRFGAVREAAAVAGHALRMRAGVDSARPAGRGLAGLTVYAVALAASLSAALLAVSLVEPLDWDGERSYAPLAYVPWLLVLALLLSGRWTWARTAVGVAVGGAVLSVPVAYWSGGPSGVSENLPTVLGLVAAAVVVLAASPDLPPTGTRARRNTALASLALGVPMLVGSLTTFQALAGPGVTESARPDPVRLFLTVAPLVLAPPAAVGLARCRFGAAFAAVVVIGGAFAYVFPHAFLTVVPYDSGRLNALVTALAGTAALILRFGLRPQFVRQRRHRRL
ncbi:hypothetical protein [Streptomyces pakalii]|uniref:Uncharacterized protein n=1 Tax=Streptomyces pakalii TaxID=3036494 RepID=A0ABT7D2K1_9ACTN|nr:hypothetical protein [Streptomyces pakalii]MDJ1640032.1 hypothetical protein [Streptomyces pakalii]